MRLKNFHSAHSSGQSRSFETSLNEILVKQDINIEWPSDGIIFLVETAQATL